MTGAARSSVADGDNRAVTESAIPDSLLRFFMPPWGGRADEHKPVCTRRTARGAACRRQAAEWPEGFVRHANPVACWSHLGDAERAWALEARERYEEAFHAARRRHLGTHPEFRWCAVCIHPGYAVEPGAKFWGRIGEGEEHS